MDNYYSNLRNTLNKINDNIAVLSANMQDEYDTNNTAYVLLQLHKAKAQAEKLLSIHKYFKVSPESFEKDKDAGIEIKHVIKSHETIQEIAKKYNTNVEFILEYNNITTNDLMAGFALRIKVKPILQTDTILDIPVYASSIDGEEILGRDLGSNLEISDNSDISVLIPKETIKQCIINNVVTEQGNYPTEEFGLGFYGDLINHNPTLAKNLWMLKTVKFLESDFRIAAVNDIQVIQDKDVAIIKVAATTINNDVIEVAQ